MLLFQILYGFDPQYRGQVLQYNLRLDIVFQSFLIFFVEAPTADPAFRSVVDAARFAVCTLPASCSDWHPVRAREER